MQIDVIREYGDGKFGTEAWSTFRISVVIRLWIFMYIHVFDNMTIWENGTSIKDCFTYQALYKALHFDFIYFFISCIFCVILRFQISYEREYK